MTTAIATANVQVLNEVTTDSQFINRLPDIWLGVLFTVLGVTAFTTAVLVAWPAITYLITR
jgi:hypothetical protein